jgi:DtxR family Mn-dependent transcriptional regulator
MEDYLKEVHLITEEGGMATTHELAVRLGITAPSVTQMVKRLDEHGLLRHAPYHGVELTEAGERVAREVIRHHRLIELYLIEHFGYPWDKAHHEAERLEHHISEEFEACLDSLLGHPTLGRDDHPIFNHDDTVVSASDSIWRHASSG